MNVPEKTILEIAVDKWNEKWVFVAREMLSTIHDVLGSEKKHFLSGKQKSIPFRFFMVHVQGRIRFFFETPTKFQEFLESQLYAHYNNIEITESTLPIDESMECFVQEGSLANITDKTIKLYVNLDDRTEKETIDPLSAITSVLSHAQKSETVFFRVDFSPLADDLFRTGIAKEIIENEKFWNFVKVFLLENFWWIRLISAPFRFFKKILQILFWWNKKAEVVADKNTDKFREREKDKFASFWYSTRLVIGSTKLERTKELATSLTIFASPNGAKFVTTKAKKIPYSETLSPYSQTKSILNATELAGLVHMPTIYVKTPGVNWVVTRRFEPPHNLPNADAPNTPIGISNFRGHKEPFGIQPTDRARHTYIIGKTGMGKSTLLENMIYSDIVAGRGVGVIDPHGDLADTILRSIPKERMDDVVIFDPSDREFPIAFNMLQAPSPELRSIVGSGLVSIFKKMFADSWWPRLEYILRNTILTLLTVRDSTLVSIPLLLTHESYRQKVVSKLRDPILQQFWTQEFDKMSPNMVSEAVNPILNKVGQFLSSPILRNILGQPNNPFTLRSIMDNEKIFIVNLSKGKIGEDSSALLGAMMITKFQIEAMTRADIPESERKDFGLYVDEFQNFATDSFATILSEARKYKLSLTMANQFTSQMPETVQGAVFGNVGTTISFQVGQQDAAILSENFGGEDIITPNDLTNLRKYDIYTKLLIDGMPSPVFSATTFAPLTEKVKFDPKLREHLLDASRKKYCKDRKSVEKSIFDYAAHIRSEEIKHKQKLDLKAASKKSQKAQENKRKMEERLRARGITPYSEQEQKTDTK